MHEEQRPYDGFGVRLKAARLARGMTVRQVADRARLQAIDINRWEKRERMEVQAKTIRPLAMALNVSADYLLGITDDLDPIGARPESSADALAARDEALRDDERRRRDRRRGERRAR